MENKITIAGIRICSKSKNPNIKSGQNCLLSELYTNTNLKGFFRKMELLKIPYYVLSRKYGICTEGKHNIAYSSTEHLTDEKLLELLKIQSKKYANTHFIPKFTHMTDLGYEVLNICMECYQKALSEYENS